MIGKTISHYKILEKLGEGGMGVVYKADDTKLDRQVALKFLPHAVSANETERQRFLVEAKAAAALNHSNIATIYAIEEADDKLFIVMEYIDGQELRELVPTGGLEIKTVVDYASQIAEGLQAAHEKGIIHRDIKSSNIMVTDKGQVKIMDFGLAKVGAGTDLTKGHSTLGTLSYMSPEQIQGQAVDTRADIFSFGVVLYEMLTGKLPFRGEYNQAVMYAIMNEKPEPIQKLRPDIFSELMHIINRTLEKDSRERYQTINDLLIELKGIKEPIRKDGRENSIKISKTKKQIINSALLKIIIMILIAIAGAIYIINRSPSGTTQQLKTIPLTSLSGHEAHPAFSPDGKQVAFSHYNKEQGNWDIYVKTIGTDSLLRLTDHLWSDWSPDWSPDGRTIAFCRSDNKGMSGIYSISLGNGNEEQLQLGRWGGIHNISWSPDGRFIAISGKSSDQEPYSIYLLSVDRKELRKLSSPPIHYKGDYGVAFSPYGKKIAFYRNKSKFSGDIYIMPISGGEPVQLTFDNSWIKGATWTKDGKEIIYSSNRGGISGLWRISANGGTSKPVPVVGQYIEEPTASFSSNCLAYVDLSHNSNIYQVDIRNQIIGQQIPKRIIASSRADYEAEYSPDGSKIVFVSMRSGTAEILICDGDGQNQRQISPIDRAMGGAPKWSPDGSKIVFDARTEGHADIFIVNADGGGQQRITKSESDDIVPCWSADGDWIFFASNRSGEWQVWKIDLNGEKFSQITEKGGYAPRISADGKWVYYTRYGASQIYKKSLEGDEESLVFDIWLGWGAWFLAENGIYYINDRKDEIAIDFFNFHTQKSHRIFSKVSNLPIRTPAVSPDGQYLIYAQIDMSGRDIILLENFQ